MKILFIFENFYIIIFYSDLCGFKKISYFDNNIFESYIDSFFILSKIQFIQIEISSYLYRILSVCTLSQVSVSHSQFLKFGNFLIEEISKT